jgi:N-methylhydantoinase B
MSELAATHSVAGSADDLDALTFSVLRHAFENTVNEMGAKIIRCAHSPVVNEGHDFGATITTADGRLVAQGDQDLPAFVGLAPIWAKSQIDWIGIENFHEGDVVVANDPYLGGTHCMDVRFMMPVFWEGELVAFTQDIAHWVDCGGPLPGGFNPKAAHILQESLRITPIHIVRRGEFDRNVAELILANVRLRDWSFGDMMSQIQALRVGEERLHALLAKYGKQTIIRAMEQSIEVSEGMMRREIEAMRDGVYRAVDYIDRDPAADSDEPLAIRLEITIEGDRLHCDLSQSSPQALGPVNGPKAVSVSALMVTIKSMFPDIPMNEGVFQAIEFDIPDGLVCSCIYPAPVSGMASACYARVLDCVYRCFIEIVPEKCMACPNTILNIIVSGTDHRAGKDGAPFVSLTWIEGGYGARPAKRDNHSAMSLFASGTQSMPMERLEREYPVLFERYEYLTDSEGAGRHRGGFGVEKKLRVLFDGGSATCQGDRERHRPWGANDGLSGGPNTLRVEPETGEPYEIGVFAVDVPLQARAVVAATTNGGGGFGSPLDRPPEWVLEDVIDELVSIERARDVYGVVIVARDPARLVYEIDDEATEALRSRLRDPAV